MGCRACVQIHARLSAAARVHLTAHGSPVCICSYLLWHVMALMKSTAGREMEKRWRVGRLRRSNNRSNEEHLCHLHCLDLSGQAE